MAGFTPVYNVSHAIKQEIQRFESVHPSIYAIYDLIEAIEDKDLQDSIRDHVVCIEDSFVNSQEWTLSRGVPELKLGVLGSQQSGKSALVHRYLTGSYMQDDSPEGGRFKKEISVPDVGSCLLLIRDEGGPPDQQFAAWCDACVFVFALDSADSLEAVYQFYGRMAQCRNLADVPLILVGTQDSISESRPRVIDEGRTRRAVQDLRRCPYYETCATYGHNVDRVFQEACHRMVSARSQLGGGGGGRPSPLHYQHQAKAPLGAYNPPVAPQQQQQQQLQQMGGQREMQQQHHQSMYYEPPVQYNYYQPPLGSPTPPPPPSQQQQPPLGQRNSRDRASFAHGAVAFAAVQGSAEPQQQQQSTSGGATPTQGRKSRRKSNLFSRKEEAAAATVAQQQQQQQQQAQAHAAAGGAATVGSGRAIPMMQGNLYKRSTGVALSRTDWKKKYAAITEDGQMTYYASLHDYMADSHGKSIDLSMSTVKVPGQPRPMSNGLLMKQQSLQPQQPQRQTSQQQQQQPPQNPHRRAKSSGRSGGGVLDSHARTPDEDAAAAAAGASVAAAPAGSGYPFTIVSLDSRTWHFEAPRLEDRDAWVSAIELGILRRLQRLSPASVTAPAAAAAAASAAASATSPASAAAAAAAASAVHLRDVLGNGQCADCGHAAPDWASLNLGVLLCIECCGAHRKLGTHLSRVRSLTLDDWPHNHLLVMRAVGNRLANSVWEARAPPGVKPGADAPLEMKEQFVRAKYERKEFLPELPYPDSPVQQQLVDAMARSDTRQVILCLAVAGPAVNRPYSQQDPRAAVHIAATLGQLAYLQLLLWYGADPAVRDSEGRSAHFYAAAAGKPECAEFLLACGCPSSTAVAASASASAASSLSSSSRRRSRGSGPAGVLSPSTAAAASANEIGL